MGSCGQSDDVETAGGGRIVVIADSVILDGPGPKLSADGRPYLDFDRKSYSLAGGSGGYIYVTTANAVRNNTISLDAEISARGGLGIGEYSGGSGGVVVLDNQLALSSLQVHVGGGAADRNDTEDGCMNGGAGTIYHRFNDTLVVDNEGVNTTALTSVKISGEKDLVDDKFQLVKKLYIVNGARLEVVEDHEDLTFDELYVWNYGQIKLGRLSERIHLHITNITYVSSHGTLDFSDTKWVGIYPALNASDISLGQIMYKEFLGIQAYNTSVSLLGTVNLGPSVKDSYKPHSKVIVQAANITVVDEINASYTFMHSNETLMLLDGAKINSLSENTCNLEINSKDLFVCIERNSLLQNITEESVTTAFAKQYHTRDNNQANFSNVLTGLKHNFTTYLLSNNEVKMFGA